MQEAERRKAIRGIKIAGGALIINHLFFADDSLLLCRANFEEWQNIRKLLDTYAKTSG